jgi:TPP-dependent pyruvate/acetoin dehydrogenase alpha subunit
MNLTLLKQMYRSLYRIRRVEEKIASVYPSDKIKSPIHLSVGQESISVGVCEALLPDDVVFGTYRGHAMYLAKGGDMNAMIAELYGKVSGCSKGKGGSMHLIDTLHGVMGTSAVVATTIPVALGYAYAMKYLRRKIITVVFFGDGATEEGVFSESLNFAALKHLPVIFVCENNLYAIHTHIRKRQANLNICERVRSFGVSTHRFENDDVLTIHECVKNEAERIRKTLDGPCFFECPTYRWKEHVGPGEDYHLGYRDHSEIVPWQENDQMRTIASRLMAEDKTRIEKEIEEEIEKAFIFAEKSSFPERVDLLKDVFAE